MTPDPESCYVYRLYDTHGQLLYVGVSRNVHVRLKAHARTRWWPQVDSKSIEEFSTREEALIAERLAIRTEAPTCNVTKYPNDRPSFAECHNLGSALFIGPEVRGVRIAPDALTQIEHIAATQDVPRTEVIRRLIDEALMYRARKAARRAVR